MDDILSFISHFEKVNDNLAEIVAIAGEKNDAELADINIEQLDEGILSTGKKITPDYSPGYAKFKGFKTPNLKLEGDFHSGIFVDRKGEFLIFDSTDYKTPKLEGKYSSDIFGIAPKNEQRAADEIDETLLKDLDNEYSKGIK
jgi:hypothetical protein